MNMSTLVRKLFRPHDGSRRAVQETVDRSIETTQIAANRLKQTIAEFMDQNDRLTGRPRYDARKLEK